MKRRYQATNSTGKDASGRRIQYCCAMCTRSLDDCLFVDEQTKMFTPYCKICRKLLRENRSLLFLYVLLLVNDTPKPRLVNAEKTKYVLESDLQPGVVSSSGSCNATIPSNFAVWDKVSQRVIINRDALYGVLPCCKWSVCDDKDVTGIVYDAKVVFHRMQYLKK